MTLIEQVKNLEAEKVALKAELENAAALALEWKKAGIEFNAKIDAQAASIAGLSNELTAVRAALETETAAHKATKESVESQASIKAQQILASAGHKPVDFAAKDEPTSAAEIKAAFNAMKPGPERSAFFKKHRNTLT